MANKLLQQGKDVEWLCDDVSGAALVKVVADEGNLVTNYDTVSSVLAYVGKSVAGSVASASVWQVRKLVFNAEGDVTTTFADGDSTYTKVWADRASLLYS